MSRQPRVLDDPSGLEEITLPTQHGRFLMCPSEEVAEHKKWLDPESDSIAARYSSIVDTDRASIMMKKLIV